MLTVCGEVALDESKWPAEVTRGEKTARYGSGTTATIIRANLGGKSGRHLHIDCAAKSLFRSGKLPKATHKQIEVVQLMDAFFGVEIKAGVVGRFTVPKKDLPEKGLIRALSVEQKTVDMSIKVRACTLALTGVPIKSLQWSETEDEQGKVMVYITVKGQRQAVLGEDYLVDMWRWIDEQFCIFVMGTRKDG